jgi:TrwC relaxase
MQGGRGAGGSGLALPAKALKVGQEDYWLDQIARDREEYFSGHGESPGRYVGSAVAASGLSGVASAEQVRAMFQGQDPATGEQRCQPLLRADPRSKLPAGPLLAALREHADARGVTQLEQLARSKALAGDVRAVEAACRAGGARRVKVETAERLCRMLLRVDPRTLYGGRSLRPGSTAASASTPAWPPSTSASPPPRASACWPPPADRPAAPR